jgi:hypothetical protein
VIPAVKNYEQGMWMMAKAEGQGEGEASRVTELQVAAKHNLQLKEQLEKQLELLRQLNPEGWNPFGPIQLSMYITQQRLELLINYMFDPQEEVSREAFELQWEQTLTEVLELALKDANTVALLVPPSATQEKAG